MKAGEARGSGPFPWREAMGFGLGVLRLSPIEFWKITPRELAAAAEGRFGRSGDVRPPSLADAIRLAAGFPDG